MKKILPLSLMILMLFSLSACGLIKNSDNAKTISTSGELTEDYTNILKDDALCAVGFIGYYQSADFKSIVKEYEAQGLAVNSDIHDLQTGNRGFLIIPKYTDISIEIVNGDDKITAAANKAIFLLCDDKVTINVTYGEQTLSFTPLIDEGDGSLVVPEGVRDITDSMLAVG